MKLKVVESSMIHAVGYNPKTRVLEVVFNSGRAYVYEGALPKIHKGLMTAGSKGRFMRAEIIDCYPCYEIGFRRR
jgi:hypothetical protein